MAGFIQTKMWLILLATAFFIGQSLCCIECDPRGNRAVKKFKIFINSQVNEDIAEFETIKRFAKTAEQAVMKFLEDDVAMLDDFAISEIASEYKKCVDLIEETDFTGVQLLQTVGLHFQRLKDKVHAIVKDSHKRRCPNKQGANSCGLMVQTYTHCDTCDKEKIICAGGLPGNQEYFDRCSCLCTGDRCTDLKTGHSCSPCRDHELRVSETVNCGERKIEVTEDEDLILECSFSWHTMLEQSYKHNFLKLLSSAYPFTPFIELETRVIKEPYLEMKNIQMFDSGMYMCSTTLNSEEPVSKIMYHVKVIRKSAKTTERFKPRPTLPDVLDMDTTATEEVKAEKIPLNLIILAAVSITVVLIAGICICICVKRCKKSRREKALENAAKKAKIRGRPYSTV